MKSVLLAVLLALTAVSRALPACKVNLQALPVTMADTRPLIFGKINGTPVRFLADSGATYSLLSPAVARQLKLPEHLAPFGLTMEGLGGTVTPSVATVDKLDVAGAVIPHIQFLVGGGEVGEDVVGILGQNFWGIADVEYDLANGVIRIARPQGCGDRPLAYWAKSQVLSRLDLAAESRDFHLTRATIRVNGVKLKALFDTGSASSFLTFAAARRAGIDPDGPQTQSNGSTRGLGRALVKTRVAPVDLLEIGDEKIEHTHLRLGDSTIPGDVDMLLGADFFLSHRIYVANSQGRIYFTYNGGPVFDLGARQKDRQAGPLVAEGSGLPASSPEGSAKDEASKPLDAGEIGRQGAAALGRQDDARAIADLTQAHNLAPSEPLYLYQRALAREQSRQPGLAISDVSDALALAPDNVEALILRARLRLAGGNRAKGVEDLDAAAKLSPEQADSRIILAELYDHSNQFDSARSQFGLWIKAHPEDSRMGPALSSLCWIGVESGQDLDAALKACDAAVRRNAKSDAILRSRGLVHFRRGEDLLAAKDIAAALQMNPKNAWALFGRGLLELRQGKLDQAKVDRLAAMAIFPKIEARASLFGLTPQPGHFDGQDQQPHIP